MAQADPEFFFSILVRTFNSEKSLQALLPALKLQPGDEIVVVDSGSKDRTITIAETYGARIFHAPPPFNYSKSLNIGFSAAKNPWVHVLSSHAIPMMPDLVEEMRTQARELPPDVVVGYGPSTLDGLGFKNVRAEICFGYAEQEKYYAFCTNSNTCYRRAAWQAAPFDETIRTAEDKIWLTKALENGSRACLVPTVRTLNRTRYSLRYMFHKGYSDARAGRTKGMSIANLVLGLGSRVKHFLASPMPWGNLLRSIVQHIGAFFGSQRSRDNRPYV